MNKTSFEISKQDLNRFMKGMEKEVKEMERKSEDALIALAFDIDRDAKKGVNVVTGRLINSIHVEHSRMQGYSYSDREGNTFDGSFSEKAGRGEVFVGTNVEYAPQHERKTSFLTWAYNANVDKLEQKFKKHLK